MLNSKGCLDFSGWALNDDRHLVLGRGAAVVSAVEALGGLNVIEFTGTAPMFTLAAPPLGSTISDHSRIQRVFHCANNECEEPWYCASDHHDCHLIGLSGSCPCMRGMEHRTLENLVDRFHDC